MCEAGRKNTFVEGTIGQFSYEFTEKIETSLNKGGWDTVVIHISLQTTEAALDFRFDNFIVIILASGKSLQ